MIDWTASSAVFVCVLYTLCLCVYVSVCVFLGVEVSGKGGVSWSLLICFVLFGYDVWGCACVCTWCTGRETAGNEFFFLSFGSRS